MVCVNNLTVCSFHSCATEASSAALSLCPLTTFSSDSVSASLRYQLTKHLIMLMQASIPIQFTKLPELFKSTDHTALKAL